MGGEVSLVAITSKLWHDFFREYVADPMMTEIPYQYSYQSCEDYFRKMTSDVTRKYFAIIANGRVVGQIYLKHIDWYAKTSSFGIALSNDLVKGKGYGTKAITALLKYAFNDLHLETIFADTVLRNVRSQHVLEKLGFTHTHDDDNFRFYKLSRSSLRLSNALR